MDASGSPLIGRARELQALKDAFDDARTCVVVLTGPAGIGKSTLAAAFEHPSGPTVLDLDLDDGASAAVVDATRAETRTLVVARSGPNVRGAAPGAVRTFELGPLDRESAVQLATSLGARDAHRIAERAAGVPQLVEHEVSESERHSSTLAVRGGALRSLRVAKVQDAVCAAAIVRTLTEPLLGAMLAIDARDVFQELVTHVPFALVEGRLSLPETLRQAALSDLLLRAPEQRTRWARRAQDALLAELGDAAIDALPRLVEELLLTCRFEPFARLHWDEARVLSLVRGDRSETAARAREAVLRFEGDASAALFDAWYALPNVELVEASDTEGRPVAFTLTASFHPDRAPPIDDPVLAATIAATRAHEPTLGPHEKVRLARFWLDYEHHQAVRPTIPQWASLVATDAVVSASVHHDVDRWRALAERPFALLAHASIADVGYGVFGIDRRRESIAAPFSRLVETCRLGRTRVELEDVAEPPLALDEHVIGELLREALRSIHRTDLLARNPLGTLTWMRSAGAPGETRSTWITRRLLELVDGLGTEGHDGTLARVVRATYLVEPRKGLAVSDSLGMGYSTYRRWLARALARLTTDLVERERASRRA
ncbi:MAG: hypothetical protein R3B99_16515 [Polyangiales bacterium]